MDKKTIILASSLFVLIIVGMFGYAYVARQATVTSDVLPESTASSTNDIPYSSITRIDATHFFINGEHTLVGSIIMPTPCEVVEVSSTVAESMPEQVLLDFSIINTAEMCAQVLTEQRFSVTFSASAEADISGVFMGRSMQLNLTPAGPGETPETIEFFNKG